MGHNLWESGIRDGFKKIDKYWVKYDFENCGLRENIGNTRDRIH